MSDDGLHRVNPEFEQEWPGSRADATEVFVNVIRAGETLTALIEGFVRDHGLPSVTALMVLEVLRGERKATGAGLAPSVIADRSVVSRPALSGVMDTLERRGFLKRSPDPNDRRRAVVEITDEGMQTLERLLPELHRAEAEWTAGLSTTQKANLLRETGRLMNQVTKLVN